VALPEKRSRTRNYMCHLEVPVKCTAHTIFLVIAALVVSVSWPSGCWALSSANIPLDSPVYLYLEKLEGFGLITTEIKGIKPFTKAEAARLLREAEDTMMQPGRDEIPLAVEIVRRLHELIPREVTLRQEPDKAPLLDYNPVAAARLRYVHLDGMPRSYVRPVYDPGGDGVFGIGGGLRPDNPYPSIANQNGTEGTPLFENNEGIVYRAGNNAEFRIAGEAYVKSYVTALVEPLLLYSVTGDSSRLLINKAYVNLGGGSLELEVGRDANWLGLGYRGNITLTNNARNLDQIKLSSPEPVSSKYLWDLKYALIVSRLDDTFTASGERHPYLLAAKLSFLPHPCVEFGLNFGKEFGGPGVRNGIGDYLRGIVGGTSEDNSNNLGGMDVRIRLPFLRYTEIYGEFSGEDSAKFWPIVESYVAGFYIPRLTADGNNDLRFEYFLGNAILYTSSTFPEGYLFQGMPLGHSQGGAAEDFFAHYSHWFSPRNRLALEYFHTERGNLGRVTVDSTGAYDPNGIRQGVERKNAARAYWHLPLYGDVDLETMYGWEKIDNFDLVPGLHRTNQFIKVDVSYRY
jgi:Capsule assembly protein Wzi